MPGGGVRKIVVATNVAETSVTIPDVVVVVDSGRVKERQWDPRRGMASLEEGWVSRASARQRAGRAGRVRPGKCYAMFTSLRASKQMRSHQVPELHRVPLTEVVLQIKKLGVGGVPDPRSRTGQGVGSGEETSAGSGDAAAFRLARWNPRRRRRWRRRSRRTHTDRRARAGAATRHEPFAKTDAENRRRRDRKRTDTTARTR